MCWHDGRAFRTPQALAGISPVVDNLLEDRDNRLWLIGPDLLYLYDGEQVRDLLPEFHRQCGFSIGYCWGLLGMPVSTLRDRLRKLGIDISRAR